MRVLLLNAIELTGTNKAPFSTSWSLKFLKPKVLDGGIRCIVEAELNAFKQYVEQDPERCVVINADQSVDDIRAQITDVVNERLLSRV